MRFSSGIRSPCRSKSRSVLYIEGAVFLHIYIYIYILILSGNVE